ncbi:MAG: AAA family ATPase [Thiohalomonadales bacterium]
MDKKILTMEVTLHFFCGKMAAGKSTLAKDLAKKEKAILVSEDDWLINLYPGEIIDIAGYVEYSTRLKNICSKHIESVLSQGVSVVLDFPGNTIEQRNWFRNIYQKASVAHTLHFIDVSNETCKRQLRERSKDKPDGTAFTSDSEFDALTKFFQAPSESENFNIIRYSHEDA